MKGNGVSEGPDRRQLPARILPAGALACLFCRHAPAATAGQREGTAPPARRKSEEPCGMSYEALFGFAYAYDFIPAMKAMGAEMGREQPVETLKRAYSAAAVERVRERLRNDPKNDLATSTDDVRNPIPLLKHAVTFQLVEDMPTAFAARITECQWARTFREADAADIGHACLCQTESAVVPAFNPKMKLAFTKTLMQGDDCCDPRYVLEA